MIEFVFTLDYEIYGDGTGSLDDLVYTPAERLRQVFLKHGLRFVNFVEVAEFERIEEAGSDPAIDRVIRQIRDLHNDGFETGLHLHPQWCNAILEQGRWSLDQGEYNLCRLPRPRVAQIIDGAIAYVRYLVDDSSFSPLSFRAGNWLFQPTQPAAAVLAERGVKIDSSVFKGGLQRRHGLDYRPALRNGRYWRFQDDVNAVDEHGQLLEVPIHTEMVPWWKMATRKRAGFPSSAGNTRRSRGVRLDRLRDLLRIRYPLKLDFCRMTLRELTWMMDRLVREDRADPGSRRPVVAIGHTKDMVDLGTVEAFLSYLETRRVRVSTFAEVLAGLDVLPRMAASGVSQTSCAQIRTEPGPRDAT
jgi:hypothetical protein